MHTHFLNNLLHQMIHILQSRTILFYFISFWIFEAQDICNIYLNKQKVIKHIYVSEAIVYKDANYFLTVTIENTLIFDCKKCCSTKPVITNMALFIPSIAYFFLI